jgi:hypothetical protein
MPGSKAIALEAGVGSPLLPLPLPLPLDIVRLGLARVRYQLKICDSGCSLQTKIGPFG